MEQKKGVEEIKAHKFFEDIDWDNLYQEPRHSTFVPRVTDVFDTGYFIQKELGDSFVEGYVHEAETKFVFLFFYFFFLFIFFVF